jgi:transcriptional regulator with XRE-family HTH domain
MMSKSISVEIGENIRSYREARHMTREQLAEAVTLDTGYLGMCERGERQLGLNKTIEIINYFGITPNDILPTSEQATSQNHSQYIAEIMDLFDDFSDNQLTATINMIKAIRTLK